MIGSHESDDRHPTCNGWLPTPCEIPEDQVEGYACSDAPRHDHYVACYHNLHPCNYPKSDPLGSDGYWILCHIDRSRFITSCGEGAVFGQVRETLASRDNIIGGGS